MSAAEILVSVLVHIPPFALAVAALVVVHELGHCLAARWRGVVADEFAVGMGPVRLPGRAASVATLCTAGALVVLMAAVTAKDVAVFIGRLALA